VEEANLYFAGNVGDLGDMMGFGGQTEDEIQEAFEDRTPVHNPANLVAESQRELAAILEADTPSCKTIDE
jgi:hypothetical protein